MKQTDANDLSDDILLELGLEQMDLLEPIPLQDQTYRYEFRIPFVSVTGEAQLSKGRLYGFTSNLRRISDTMFRCLNEGKQIALMAKFGAENLSVSTNARISLNVRI